MGGRIGDWEGEGRIKEDSHVLGLGDRVGGDPIHWERIHKRKDKIVRRGVCLVLDMFVKSEGAVGHEGIGFS